MSMSRAPTSIFTYGNCQVKSIAYYLRQHPNLQTAKIDYFYVLDNIETLDLDQFKQVDVFIYQHTSVKALRGGTSEQRLQRCSDYITKHLLRPDCIVISIPSVYDSSLFPNVMTTKEAAVGFRPDTPPEIFPNYTFNRKLHHMLTKEKLDTEAILRIMTDKDLYSATELQLNVDRNYSNLRQREIENQITIPLADYIRSQYQAQRLCLTTNHPSRIFFHYLLNEILKKMYLPLSNAALEVADPMEKLGRAPILPCVTKHLQLQPEGYQKNEIWVNGYMCSTYEEYIDYLRGFVDASFSVV